MKRIVALITGAWLLPVLAPAAEDGVNVIPSDVGLQVWVLATFLVTFFLLAKLAFKPIAEALDRRSATIKQSLADAEQARAAAKQALDDYQQKIAAAQQEAKQLKDEGKALGENIRKEVVEKANAEAQAILQRASEEMTRQKEKSLQELKDTVAELSVQIAGKVIEKQVDAQAHRQLIESLITDLSKIRKA